MNKIKNTIVCTLCFCVLLLCSCKSEASENDAPMEIEPPAPTEAAVTPPPSEKPVQWITADENIDISGMELYRQTNSIQFPADDDAKLSLFVNAEKNDEGDFLFDDGNQWLLLMETSHGVYPLFPRQYVQLGAVSYVSFNDLNGDTPVAHVVVTVAQTAGYRIYDCVFDDEQQAFMLLPVYDMANINYFGGSVR